MTKRFFSGLFFIIHLLILVPSCSKKDEVDPYTIIYKDDFTDNRNKWYLRKDDTVTVELHNGSLFIKNNDKSSGWGEWQNVNINTSKKFSIKTSIVKFAGVDNYGYGLIWGMKDINNCYIFNIAENGYFYIGKMANGTYSNIVPWTNFTGYNYLKGETVLEIKKSGNDLFFFINNIEVKKISFMSLMGNGVGFVVYKDIGCGI